MKSQARNVNRSGIAPMASQGESSTFVTHGDLLRLAQGQALRNEELRELVARLGGEGKPLRYRLADLVHGWLGRIPFLRGVLRRVLWALWRRHPCQAASGRRGIH